MPITVILRRERLEAPAPSNVGETLEYLGIPAEQYLVLLNGEIVTTDQALMDGDTIRLVGVISGGSGSVGRVGRT
jgi:sulfur carrier protein ThiS